MTTLTSLPFFTTAIAVVVGLIVVAYRAALPKPLPGIPYHKPLFRHPLGDALDFLMYRVRNGDMFGLLPVRLRELDSPIMQIFIRPFKRPYVVICDPHETNDILTRRSKEFDRSSYFGDMLKALLPHNHLHMPTNADWAAHRRLISETMSPSFLNEVAGPLFWSTAQDMIEWWRLKARCAQGRPFSAAEDIYDTALEMVWHAVLGSAPGTIRAEIALLAGNPALPLRSSMDIPVDFPRAKHPVAFEAIRTLTDSLDIPVNSIMPKPHHRVALNTSPSLIASGRQKDAMLHEHVKKAEADLLDRIDDGSKQQYTSAIDLVLHRERTMAEKEGRAAAYDSRVIADELFGFLFAGHETTSTTICWAIKFLTADQHVQSKLRAALQSSFSHARRTRGQPSIKEIISSDIPYLDAVIAEIHRKGTTVVALSRTALVDTTVLGHPIPKGTDVFFLNSSPGMQSPPLSRRSPANSATSERYPAWDPDSIGAFLPERWLRRGEDGKERFNNLAGPSFPFGAGQRACFGRRWAQLELRVVLSLIVWNFELQPLPERLAGFGAVDGITHKPRECFVRLNEVQLG